MGSAPCGVACARLGLNYIGIERDATHFETAKKRMEAELMQGTFDFSGGAVAPTHNPGVQQTTIRRTTLIPHLTHDRGIVTQRPGLTSSNGCTGHVDIYGWFRALSKRLRHVKVVCGDWSRICGGNWRDEHSSVGMFFDPPYATGYRDKNLYHKDSMTVGKDVETWVLENGKKENHRIVVCGYEDEYHRLVDAGWRVEAWKANGGYSNKGKNKSDNRYRERVFISPHCLRP